jgi:hypothetical protein
VVSTALKSQIQEDFQFLLENKEVLGIFLYGSYAEEEATPHSDIDICVITRKKQKQFLTSLLNQIWGNVPVKTKQYDVRLFQELPLFIQGQVIESGILILSNDPPEVYEILYPYRREWEDQKNRNQLSEDEIAEIFTDKL